MLRPLISGQLCRNIPNTVRSNISEWRVSSGDDSLLPPGVRECVHGYALLECRLKGKHSNMKNGSLRSGIYSDSRTLSDRHQRSLRVITISYGFVYQP